MIADQEARRRLPRKRLGDLLGCRLGRRVLGDVEVHDPAPGMGQHNEDEEDPERDRGNHEEVDGHEILDVVLKEGTPCRRRRPPRPDHVLLDGGLGDADAKLGKFSDDPRRAPARIRPRHLADQVLDLLGHCRPAGPCAGKESPVVPEPATLPCDYRAWLDEDQNIPPARPRSGQQRPE